MLETIQIASPCSAEWSEMVGDDRVRFCNSCEKNVYNLSAMLAEDADRLLTERAGKDLCVRFFQRADGTMMTSDCPVGVTRNRRKKIALAVAGAGALAFGALASLRETQGGLQRSAMVEIAVVAAPPPAMTASTAIVTALPPQPSGPVTMGTALAVVETQGKVAVAQGGIKSPHPMPPPVRPFMGRRSPPSGAL